MNPSKVLLALCAVFAGQKVQGQMEGYVWHFGQGKCLDFNSGVGVEVEGSAMWTFEGCASFCDAAGNVLFYTNGGGRIPAGGQDTGHIWDKNNTVMYDMQGVEGGGFSAAQSSVIVPKPGASDVYYVFTVDEIEHYVDATPEVLAAEPNGRGFRYFTVDMALNAGLGGVVEADVPVHDASFEGLCAIRHANEEDYWILINQDSTGIGVYSVTAAGVSLASVFPTSGPATSPIKAAPGTLFGSPCCVKVVAAGGLLFDFDHSTGDLVSLETLPYVGSEACEFSHNARYLYSTATVPASGGIQALVRYDFSEAIETGTTVSATQEVLSAGADFSAFYMQIAPDQRIYYTRFNEANEVCLGAIHCTNNDVPGVNNEVFNYGPVGGNGENLFYALPNFPAWLFYQPYVDQIEFGPDTVFLCPGDSLVLDAGLGEYWEWGGDCFSGPEDTWPDNATRFFTVTEPGTYVACVSGPCSAEGGAGGCDSSDQITVLPCAEPEVECELISLPDSLFHCPSDTVQLTADLGELSGIAGLLWTGGTGTFIPSDTVPNPLYMPSAQEVASGEVELTVTLTWNDAAGTGGRFIGYEHSGEDLLFYIDPETGSVDSIQENTGLDWTALGLRAEDCALYGLSNITFAPALYSVSLETNTSSLISSYNLDFFAGEYDQVHDVFFAIGMEDTSTGEPTDQLLYAIDVQTGVATEVGNLGLPGIDGFFFADLDGINGLAYNPDLDLLYAITTAGFLLQIDPEAADVIAVLPSVPQLRGLAYDPVADELWGIASSGTTYRIDPSTGAELEQVQCDVPFSFVTSLGYVPPVCGGGDVCSASTVLVFADPAALDLGDDLLLCEGEAFAFSVSGFEQYLWQDGSADPSLEVTLPGAYVLTATDALGCIYVDSIAVEYAGLPDFGFVANPQPTTIEFTELTFLALDVPEGGTFDWTFESGEPALSDASDPVVVFPPVAGTYDVTLTVITPEGCSATAVSSITIGTDGGLTLPNVFTPNGDGRNERFVPFEAFPGFWTLSVFDRWGNLVFETEDLSTGWDGGDSADGTYYFVAEPLEGQLGQSRSGHFTLMRNP